MRRTTPAAIVNETIDPTQPVELFSSVELLTHVKERAALLRLNAASGEIAREFSESITHLEDAITRYNKGTYMADGTFAITDAERSHDE